MRLAVIGLLLGLAMAFGLARLLESQLFGVTTTDPLSYAGVAAVLILVAVLSSYLPGRRAAAVDPNVALRYE